MNEDKLRDYLKWVTGDLAQTRQRLRDLEAAQQEPIAIVAMGCRFPGGVTSPEDLWQLLLDGRDAIGDFPADRGWDLGALFDDDPDRPGSTYTRVGGFLDDAADFDAGLFGISPREALAMDPQQRLLLETSWEAFERAGLDPRRMRGTPTGVFVGTNGQEYLNLLTQAEENVEGYLGTGNAASVVSGRLSYTFGLEGPAVTVDTACSASLVALHLATQALRRGECNLALAGGVTVMSTPGVFVEFSRQRGLAVDGRCKAFSDDADGTGWGEGAGVLLLERLSDAVANGHPVLAVVRGSAVNQDGASNGLTAPNGPAQQRVIRAALAAAGIAATEVDAVEAHGTGTGLGDPIEAQALLATYGQGRDEPLWLGSVKSNIGHTQAAAGVAGIIKMVLAMRHGQLPRTLHVTAPSSHVDWTAGAVELLTETRTWPAVDRPRRAAVSSFGVSGTNAHVILEQPPAAEAADETPRVSLPVVPWLASGHTPEALDAQLQRLRDIPAADPFDVGYSLATGRSGLEHRAVQLGDTAIRGSVRAGGSAMLFTGQGAQRAGMGRGLYETFPAYAAAYDEVCAHIDGLRDVDGTELDETRWTQPALFAVEVAVYRLLESWGLKPDFLLGHSIGELAAAHVAGVWSLPDACKVVEARGRLMQALPAGGAMVAVQATEDEVRAVLVDGAEIAAVNGPDAVVVSGDEAAVVAVAAHFKKTRRLKVSHAFHSARMDGMLDAFREVLSTVTFNPPAVPIAATSTGEVADPEYWVRQVRGTVRFADAAEALQAKGVTRFLEVGPDGVLSALVDGIPAMRKGRDEALTLMTAVAQAHVTGWSPDWTRLFAGARRVDLPTYAFQRQRYWPTPRHRAQPDTEFWAAVESGDLSDLLGVDADTIVPALTSWRQRRQSNVDGWLYHETWTALPSDTTTLNGTWLVVGAPQIAAALAAAGIDTVTVPSPVDLPAGPFAGVVAAPADAAEALTLVQAGVGAPLWCVTRDAATDPAQRAVWGLGRVAALEHPARWGGLIDVDETGLPLLATVLGGAEDQVQIRSGAAYGRRLAKAAAKPGWRPSGTVLVTGGTGALGVHVARWLAVEGASRIVLVSRRGPDAPGASQLDIPGVELVAADIAQPGVAADLVRRFTPTAVIHAAGIVDDGVIDALTPERLAAVMTAKVEGALHLDAATRGVRLDAFVLFSSFAGSVGSAGQGNYAAANAALDAIAEQRRDAGLPAVSIAWGTWAGDGMAGALGDKHRRGGVRPMHPSTAVTALSRVGGDATVVVADIDWDTFGPAFTTVRPAPLITGLAPGTGPAAATDPLVARLAALPAAERHPMLLDLVRERAAAVLGHTGTGAVGADKAFRDLGFDSLTAVEFRNAIAAATGSTLPSTLVFDYPTPAGLAQHLLDTLLGGTVPATTTPAAGSTDEPIAIVAMAGRFPGGATTPEALWDLLVEGRDAMGEFPADRGWDLDSLFDPDPDRTGTSYARAGGFLPGVAGFDAGFFGISPREALAMDPQQRLLLETAWEVFERAGIDASTLRGSATGVFVGTNGQDYGALLAHATENVEGYQGTGNAASVVSGRLSYTFGLEGPAVTVDTACSASLVALHLAVQALHRGECGMALAGGVTVMSTPGLFVEFSRQRGLAVDGRCKAFSDDADGTGWGEGVGLLLLERLSDAQRLGHPILAVVKGSAVNQDGASNGLTAPNGPSQQRVIRAALTAAGLRPSDVDAVEAHGTGTSLGDPIEAQALLATYGQDRDTPLWLGSVKSNIGHTQAAAGVAGVMKMVLAMRHRTLPRTLHVTAPSSHVDWTGGAVELLTETQPWPDTGRPRRAGVSSFGVSGTNAHVILEEAPEPAAADTVPGAEPAAVPWLLSARSAAGLRDQAGRLSAYLSGRRHLSATDIGHSLATTRGALPHRAVVAGPDRDTLLRHLTDLADGTPTTSAVTGHAEPAGKVAFLFPGQGSQWAGMATGLLDTAPVFAEHIARCEEALQPFVDWRLTDVLRGAPGAPTLDRVDVVQPVLFAVMVSLAELWRAHGVEPAAVVGHSQGEIAAAAVSGLLTLPDAARVVALRSQALLELAGHGGMMAVSAPVDEVQRRIAAWSGRLSVAAVNGPTSVVVSGDVDAVVACLAACAADDVRARPIDVDYASHSAHVETIHDTLLSVLAPVRPGEPRIAFRSTVGDAGDVEVGSAAYWFTNLRQTVAFEPAIRALAGEGFTAFIEVSPHPVVTVGVQETLDTAGSDAVVTGTLRRDDGGPVRFLTALAQLWTGGGTVDWATVFAGSGARTVALPTYAFQPTRFWPTLNLGAAPTSTLDGRFWDAVEHADLTGLATTLRVEPEALSPLLPALTAWHAEQRTGAALAGWRYRTTWKALTEQPAPRASGPWLALVPSAPVATGLLEGLRRHGLDVTAVTVDAATTDRAGLTLTVAEMAAPAGILSLLALDERPRPDQPHVTAGTAATLLLAQALADLGAGAPLWCLTAGAVSTGPGDPLRAVDQAAVWGLGRIIGLEHPGRWGGLIDLPAGRDTLDEAALRQVAGVLTGGGAEDQVAIRPEGVLGRRLGAAPAAATGTGDWQPTGTVLVTGGTGALGGRVARWLAGRGASHLVLASRRGPEAPGAAELVAELEALGAGVSVVGCDLADRAAVAAMLAAVEATAGPVRAVVHAAGLPQSQPLPGMDLADFAAVYAGKAAGARHLDELTGDLDAFVLFSSIAAAWGSGGQAAYAAGNAVLDAVAEDRRARGAAATAVQWGAWAGSGMAADDISRDALVRRGIRPMPPETALAALAGAVAGRDAVVTVADVDWTRFVPAFTTARPSPLLGDLPGVAELTATDSGPGTGGDALRDRLAPLTAAERDAALLDLVRAEAAAVLRLGGAGDLEVARPFRELGFDSLTAVELRNRLGAATGLRLPMTLVFDHPTARAIARHLATTLFTSGETVAAGPAASATATAADEPVAIVAMACRFPGGVSDAESLWQLVVDGVDAVAGMPGDRGWDVAGLYGPQHDGHSTTTEGGFLDTATLFDAGLFNISPREALAMDPQQRLLLETSWQLFERAGLDPQALHGSATGVFVGASPSGYASNLTTIPDELAGHLLTGNSGSVLSGRLSYTYGLQGPALTVDTACSSSLVALHLAVQALRRGECRLAVAGGVTVMATPGVFAEFSRQGGLAAQGRCRAFSDDADGTGWGEGVGLLLVERLSDAVANGHPVLAVVKGSAVNQDGASNGLTAPNGPAQQRVIREALAAAGLGTGDIDAVEAHGTGTSLGDPIEAQALLATYGQDRATPLWLGSLKSNIGHTQAAAGVAGIIKTVMALRHGVLPRTLHVDAPSSKVDWSGGAVELLTEARDWPALDRPRRAGVSAFGVSGTNAHIILEQAPAADDAHEATPRTALPVTPWVVSGHTAAALDAQLDQVRAVTGPDPADVGFSLATGRSGLEHRAVLLGGTVIRGRARDGGTAMLFTGQGAQRAGMGRGLYETFPAYAAAYDEVCEHIDGLADVDGDLLDQTQWTQPALFAVEVAVYRLLESWGLKPDFLLGHSIGELAAAHVAGVWSLADACKVVTARGRLMQALPAGGAMVAIRASEDRVRAALVDGAEIAAVNGPDAVVVSGDEAAVEAVAARFEKTRRLKVSHAFHSARMDGMLDAFREVLSTVTFNPPAVPIAATSTGEVTDPEYWVRQVRGTVRFADAANALKAKGVTTFLEVGPDGILSALVDGIPALRKDRDEALTLMTAVAQAHVTGWSPDWTRLFAGARRVDLPTYAFQRQRYWLDTAEQGPHGIGHPLLAEVVPIAGGDGFVVTGKASVHRHPWLAQHVVRGDAYLPGAVLVDLAVRAADEAGCDRLDELVLEASLPVPASGTVELQVAVGGPDRLGSRQVTVYSRTDGETWTRHAHGSASTGTAGPADQLTQWPPAGAEPVAVDSLYDRWADAGFAYGPAFQGLRAAWRSGDSLYADVDVDPQPGDDAFWLRPALLDAALHALALGVLPGLDGDLLPFSWNGFALHATGARRLRVRLTPTGRPGAVAILAADPTGAAVVTVDALVLRPTGAPAASREPQALRSAAEAVAVPAKPAQTSATAPRRRSAAVAPTGNALTDRLNGLDETAQRDLLVALVLDSTALVLGHADASSVEADQPFKNLGVNSLTAVELRNALAEATGVRLPATLVFDQPTPAAVAAHLRQELLDLPDTAVAEPETGSATVDEPIAIVGMACRYPGDVNSADDLWNLVMAGGDAITPFPTNRGWDVEALYNPDPDAPGTCYSQGGGFLHDAGDFDPAFFGISPREALSMDPQHRLLLETSWEALEHAGLDPVSLRGSQTGVFAGVTYQDYVGLLMLAKESAEGLIGSGNSFSVLSGRIAYTFGLEGPAVSVDTACSSSLVALHWAIQSLRAGDCTLALAGGVTVMSTPVSLIDYSRQRALAPDGRCKPFSAAADGASWSEGAGMVLLERLCDAQRNGHTVLAVIRGSAVNQDGASNGLTAPSGPAQQRVIRRALANARLSTAEVDAVEAHGTGTPLGDPIEAQALLATYGQDRDEPLWLGSLKSNIGHPQAAAGVGGVIKMVQALRHGMLPRTLHVTEPSPHVDWTAGAVELLTETRAWPDVDRPRRAAVSSFGMSGTNAHVILEQAPPSDPAAAPPPLPVVPLPVSARTPEAVDASIARLHETNADPMDVGYSLAVGRAAFDHRAVVLGDAVVRGKAGKGGSAMLFTGQGAQRSGMGRGLHATFPAYAKAYDEVCEHIDGLVDVDGDLLDQTQWTQPALFAVEVAVYRLLESWGLKPDFLLGHSIGELAAAHVAGVWSLQDACKIVEARGRLMQALPAGGAMVAIQAAEADVRAVLVEGAEIAAVNGPKAVVISGDEAAVEAVAAGFAKTRRLTVSHAFHSARMDGMLDAFRDVLATVEFNPPAIPIATTSTGEVTDPEYWVRQVRGTVRFDDAAATLTTKGVTRFLEVGPDGILSALVDGIPAMRKGRDEALTLMTAVAQAHVTGWSPDWTRLFNGARRVDVPTYAFQHVQYWPTIELPKAGSATGTVDAAFWDAVDSADLDTLAGTLRVDAQALAPVLPALASWRRRKGEQSTVDTWRYQIRWRPAQPDQTATLTGTWLVVHRTPDDLVDRVVEGLTAAGATALPVTEVPEGSYAGIVSLLALQDGIAATTALIQQTTGVDAPLWVLTSGAVSIGASDPLRSPAHAGVWGLGRAAALEYPQRWGGLIDLPETVDDRTVQRLTTVLAGGGAEDQVAVRGSGTFTRRLVHAPAPQRPAGAPTWKPRGTALVTGGTGALGAHIARWLARGGAEHLVLTSRRGDATPGAAELRAELEALGARVDIPACDVADRAAVAALLDTLPDLRVVVHAAGVPQSQVLDGMTGADFDAVYVPKADGAAHLDELTGDLDAFVLFSSISATWGSGGQAAYAAANAALDGIAQHRRARGHAATAVAWGPWAGGGMVTAEEGTEEFLRRRGLHVLDPQLAVNALQGALDADETSLTVADVDWAKFAPGFTGSRPSPLLGDLPEVAALETAVETVDATFRDGLAAMSVADRIGTLVDLVRAEAATALGHTRADAVDAEQAFRDLGFDSLTAVELRNRLNAATGLKLPATLLFDHPTANALAAHLAGELVTGAVEAPKQEITAYTDEPIAIVSMSCRFPGGVSTPEALWDLVVSRGDAVSAFPADRGWDLDGIYDPDPDHAGTSYVREGGFLARVADFDPQFFGISPREALTMDPQQRLLLEVAWEAFERAGIDPLSVRGERVGVFAGTNGQDYIATLAAASAFDEGYVGTGNTAAVMSGRISYTLGLEGPAVTVDTACSSSLVAMHWAAQALRNGECELALAGGVTVMTTPGSFIAFSRQRGLATDGRCKAFSDDADGTNWGEGAGLVLLERLSDAQRNGHTVLAVIRAAGINQDGASNGLTAPNGPAQQRLIRQVLATAGLRAADVDLVEAHGTGTSLGDPIEAQALLATYGQDRPADRPLWLGSVKSNIGHTQAAAGVAGVIKAVQALQHRTLPPTLHAAAPSSHVDWTTGAVRLITETTDWQPAQGPRRAGVSAFGISGTNGHLILEEAPPVAVVAGMPAVPAEPVALVLSARGEDALAGQAAQLADHLDERPQLRPADVAATLATGRALLADRAAVVGTGHDDLLAGLRAIAGGTGHPAVVRAATAGPGRTAVLFTGQGAQRSGMGERLHATHPVFAAAFDDTCARFDLLLDRPLRDLAFTGGDALDRTGYTQPALFAFELAMFRLAESVGLTADAVIGHSIGEIVAAHVAGVFDLDDACRLVAARAALMQALPVGGAMLAVQAAEDEVLPLLDGTAGIAAVNGPHAVVVSGDEAAVERIAAHFTEAGRRTRRLRVSHAFHSPRMDGMLAEFGRVAATVTYRPPRLPVISNLTGAFAAAGDLTDAGYWVRHVREAVRFADGIAALHAAGYSRFVEVGPDAVLTAMAHDGLPQDATCVALSRRDRPETEAFLRGAAQLVTAGVTLDRAAAFTPVWAVPVALPTYAFQRTRFWPRPGTGGVGGAAGLAGAGLETADHPLLGAAVTLADTGTVVMTGRLSTRTHPWLADHALPGAVIVPGTALLELALRAGDEVGCPVVDELTLAAPLTLPDRGAAEIQVRVDPPADDSEARPVTIHARPADGGHPWTLHATGLLTAGEVTAADQNPNPDPDPDPDPAWLPAGAEPVSLDGFYAGLAVAGFRYGPVFQGLEAAWRVGDDVYAEVALPDGAAEDADRFTVHPALLDAALHAVALTGLGRTDRGRLPFAWTGVTVHAAGATRLRVRLRTLGTDAVALTVTDPAGAPVATVASLTLRELSAARPAAASVTEGLLRLDWQVLRLPAPAGQPLRWAVVGEDRLGFGAAAEAAGVHLESYADLPALAAAADNGARVPATVFVVSAGAGADRVAAAHELAARALADVQEWLASPAFGGSRLVFLTRDAVGDDVRDPAAAVVHGLVRSAQSENPELFVLVDLDTSADSLTALPAALDTGEPALLLQGGTARIPRLATVSGVEELTPPDGPWRLTRGEDGTLEGLTVERADEAAGELRPGQVRIAVRAGGVNFRDVLNALGMYPGEAGSLGQEGAGVVTEVGPGVTGFAVGERVMGMFPGAFGPVAVADHRMIVGVPAGWSYAQAASVPLVFLTAYYSLVDLGGLRPGERVLVHAAAGGVGMAAVQLARHLGAEVLATAGAGKWPVVRGLGVDGTHLASSRTVAFEAEFLQLTGGDGVDLVLNALAREFVDASLRLLPRGGRFLEMGKTDVRDADAVAAAHPGVRYRAFDLIEAGPDRIGVMLRELVAMFEEGVLAPLPVTAWDVRRARDAFRYISQTRHVGKVVLTFAPSLRTEHTALVTGGTGGLGAEVARHLVTRHGIRHLLLASRSGEHAAGAAQLRAELTALGADVTIAACDVADRDAVAALVASVPADRPLTAVVHTAGVLDDATVGGLDASRLSAVLRPKVDAVTHLDELTVGHDLAVFAVYSSVSGLIGGAGQSNYAAANAYLDAWAQRRAGRGLPATALAWGPWVTASGMTSDLTDADVRRMSRGGLLPLDPARGLALFDAAVGRAEPLAVPMLLDLPVLKGGAVAPLLRGLVRAPARRAAGRSTAAVSLTERLAGAAPDARETLVLDFVRAQVAAVLGFTTPDAVPPGQSLLEAGFDSLTAVELRNRIGAATGLRLPPTLVFDHPTPAALTTHLLAELAGTPAAATSAPEAAPTGREDGIGAMFRDACRNGQVDQGYALLRAAAALRPTFKARADFGRELQPVKLASGPTGDDRRPVLICFSSFVALAGVHQYARLAANFRDTYDVWALSVPGFLTDERLPATWETVTDMQAELVRECVGDRPAVLLGSSGGGLLAHAAASRLHDLGAPAAGVVLLDTYPATEDSPLTKFQAELIDGMFDRQGLFTSLDSARLTAMSWYFDLFGGWRPGELSTPSLLLRSSEPIVATGPDGPYARHEWQTSWQDADTTIDVPGNHFTMMEHHAGSTAQAVRQWVDEAVRGAR
ncbi:type I polyketide synthase [Dactylosporangium siamense]|uniref:type I polyketide synthase n=1 Tax=Dactylosporangium siamense TaxID=685454 RepID=UPI00361D7F15